MHQNRMVIESRSVDPQVVLNVIREFLERSNRGHVLATPETRLHGDDNALNLDSLETAELSAILEDSLGFDPFSVGLLPRTIGDILAFYAGSAA
jgi:acyl carrier protein